MSRMRISGRPWAGLVTGLAVIFAAGCDGENAFQPQTSIGSAGVAVDIENPGAEVNSHTIGDSLLVTARVASGKGIEKVTYEGFALRGDPDLGTQQRVPRFAPKTVDLFGLATDTLLSRYLLPSEVDPDVREQVFVVVKAENADGEISADTSNVLLGGTKVELLDIVDGQAIQSGLSLAVRVRGTDPDGVLQLQLDFSGAFDAQILRSFNPAVDSAAMDTVVAIPPGIEGEVQVVASARNTLDIIGLAGPFTLFVGSAGAGDELSPSVASQSESGLRLELTDPVTVTVSGRDNNPGSGVARAGYTVRSISPARGDTLVQSDDQLFSPPRTGNVVSTFQFTPFNVDSLGLPDTLVFEVTGYMVDGNGNCSASVDSSPEVLPCTTLPGGQIVAEERSGERLIRSVVAGRTVFLPEGGEILDAEVDTIRRNLFLSNNTRDRVEIFGLQTEEFFDPIPVGSEPWGLDLSRGEDTLMVANSGGTNISNVYLGPPVNLNPPFQDHTEDPSRRIITPDVVLFDVERRVDATGALRYRVTFHPDAERPGFSDRPQYMAVDSTGRVLYSTKTTALGEYGTIRRAWTPTTGLQLTEVRLFYEHGELIDAPDFVAVANVDNIGITSTPLTDLATLFDHILGDTITIFNDPPLLIEQTPAALRPLGSDVEMFSGRWSVPNIGFHDTTYVAASGDRGWVVFGEGSIEPVGRVIMYNAATDRLSGVIPVTDLLTNASESVRGVSLNHDGTLGVARGFQAYFFSTDLRLQGVADLPAGGAGAALHPLHADFPSRENLDGRYDPDTHLAFVGTGERTVDIIDAFHFNRVGRLFIKDVIAGPLRAVLPFPEDNAAFSCQTKAVFNGSGQLIGQAVDLFADEQGNVPYPPSGGPTDDRCVVIKLFGISDSGGVVVVDVRKGDILREHPSRL